jgi:DNA transposition AAA+ family ATPase
MTEDQSLYNNVAPLANVAALVTLIERVERRDYGLPGMATFYGPSGFGKSYGAIYAANRFDACLVQVKSSWRPRYLCTAILIELGVKPKGTVADLAARVSEELARSARPLLIDEADFLVERGMVELAREFHESSGSPVILIGEELLPQKLQAWERVHGRMLDWVAAQEGTLSDVRHLSDIYCRGVTLSDDLAQMVLERSARSIRRISVNLSRLREFAMMHGLTALTREDWAKAGAGLYTGEAPEARRHLAIGAAPARRRVA